MNLQEHFSIQLDQRVGQMRAVPVQVKEQRNLLLAYAADEEIDPYIAMFFFPTDTLKLHMVSPEGKTLWKKELHRGNIPGTWFLPIFPFDLDGDGIEEIWMVQNSDPEHPLDIAKYQLVRIDPETGETTGGFPWKGLNHAVYTNSQRYRHFLLGGYVNGQPVLVTAQGTYTKLQFQAWNPGMEPRWTREVEPDDKGSRGSHSCAVLDIDGDGNDEFMYGERCLRLDDGSYQFIGDEHVYRGHSDVISPLFNEAENKWYIFTTRESDGELVAPPRVVMFKDNGRRLWSDLEEGHMDMGWAARIGEAGELLCYAIRIGAKRAGPKGFFREGTEEYVWKPLTGERVQLPYSLYERLPVDLDGDGLHELVGSGKVVAPDVINTRGETVAELGEGGRVALLSKFVDRPGEQLLAYYEDGRVRVLYDADAKDSPAALRRYARTAYRSIQRLSAVGYSLNLLGGV